MSKPEPATAHDLSSVVALLSSSGLPSEGVEENFPSAFSVVRVAGEVGAVAGLERHGEFGLLRSLSVRSDLRGEGLGRALVEERLLAARGQGLAAVFLLTTTATEYFRRLGFADVERARVPAIVQRSSEFATICPSSAACLTKRLR